ncbi:hypothetical protein ACSS6W_010200 [Trichoderma asperelloides]
MLRGRPRLANVTCYRHRGRIIRVRHGLASPRQRGGGLRLHSAIDHDILAGRLAMASPNASTVQPPAISWTCHSWTAPDWQSVACCLVCYPTGIKQAERGMRTSRAPELELELPAYQWSSARDALGMLPCHSFRLALYRTSPPTSVLQPNSRTPIQFPIIFLLIALFPPTASSATSHPTRVILQGSWL